MFLIACVAVALFADSRASAKSFPSSQVGGYGANSKHIEDASVGSHTLSQNALF
jgi:hypothetical protein